METCLISLNNPVIYAETWPYWTSHNRDDIIYDGLNRHLHFNLTQSEMLFVPCCFVVVTSQVLINISHVNKSAPATDNQYNISYNQECFYFCETSETNETSEQ